MACLTQDAKFGELLELVTEKEIRSERALKLALAEMYICGVSTRKVAKITEQMCGFDISSAQVSRAAAELKILWRRGFPAIPKM